MVRKHLKILGFVASVIGLVIWLNEALMIVQINQVLPYLFTILIGMLLTLFGCILWLI